jgi:hypothetical protein
LSGDLYDHLIAVVVVSVLFVAAVVAVPNISYIGLFSMDQQQLRNLALNTLKTMLLDTGYPEDWGSLQEFTNGTIERFGLAFDDSSSFYVLDPDKVSRLVRENPEGHLGYERIRDLLGLQDYGFNFRIIPPFRVLVNDEDFDGQNDPITLKELEEGIEVVVLFNDGSPIPRAAVEVTLIYVLDKDSTYNTAKANKRTDALGKCEINLSDFDPPIESTDAITDFIVVFNVTVADVATVTSSYMQSSHENVVDVSIVGDNITLWISENNVPQNTSQMVIENVIAVDENGAWNLYAGGDTPEDIMTPGEGFYYWSHLFYGLSDDPPLFLIFNLKVTFGGVGGRQLILLVGPRPNWTGLRVQGYGDPAGINSASSAVTVQRAVIIARMTYIAELTLWKESP